MSNVKECDRCFEMYGEYGEGFSGNLKLLDRDGTEMDLCISCNGDLERFKEGQSIKKLK